MHKISQDDLKNAIFYILLNIDLFFQFYNQNSQYGILIIEITIL